MDDLKALSERKCEFYSLFHHFLSMYLCVCVYSCVCECVMCFCVHFTIKSQFNSHVDYKKTFIMLYLVL